jgi:hypothetical protein
MLWLSIINGDSTVQHKWMVMVVFERICKDKQMLMDVFVNYDCDEYMTNLFERMFNSLSRWEYV